MLLEREPGAVGRPRRGGVGDAAVIDEVRAGAVVAPFRIDDYTRWRLLEGLDDIGITLSHEDDVVAYEATRPSWKPATL